MTIHWPFLLLAAGLLWLPLWLPSELRSRFAVKARSARATLSGLLTTPVNWLDLVRAGVGIWILQHGAVEVDPSISGAAKQALLVQAGILTVGLLLQSVRIHPRILFLAPAFYLTGVTLLLPGFWEGGFAVFVGWTFAVGSRNPAYLLPAMAVALAVGGALLEGFTLTIPLTIGLLMLPLILSFLFQHRLVFLTKSAADPSDSGRGPVSRGQENSV